MKFIYAKNAIFENLQQARKILKKRKVDETDPTFIELRELVENKFNNNLGYLGFFTKLIFEKRYKISDIEKLADILIDNKKVLK